MVAPRDAARAIVIHNGKLLVMKRSKPDVGSYVVLLGGRLEPDETAQQAVIREVAEESGVIIANPRLVFIEEPHSRWGRQYVFLCDYISGEPMLPTESEEYQAQQEGYGTFEPAWMSASALQNASITFRTERLKIEILRALKKGFPSDPKLWTP